MQKIIAEIDTEKLRYNAKLFKERSGAKLCAVVKANAYGHGDIGCVSALSKVADYFAVALVEEALSIKLAAAGKEIWVLTPPTDCETVLVAAQNGFTLCVADYPSAKRIVSVAERYGVDVKVHIKLNTGMNRYGLGSKNLFKVCRYLAAHPLVHVTGMYGVHNSSIKALLICTEVVQVISAIVGRQKEKAIRFARRHFLRILR